MAKLFLVSTSDGHGQGLGSWQSSSLSPPLTAMDKGLGRGKALPCLHTFMGKGLGRGKALPCPPSNAVCPFLSLSAPSVSTLNCTLEDGLRRATGSCHMIIPLQFSFLNGSQQFFIAIHVLGDGCTHCLIRNVFCICDAEYPSKTSHFHCLDFSLLLVCRLANFSLFLSTLRSELHSARC